jgi:TetR/AcrR family fatty acid metabolism transcriptional regulator
MPKIIDKDEKKAEILRAAMQVFSQKGVAKTKIIDIAKSARVGKGTIYEYFGSKEDIFREAFEKVYYESERLLEEAIVSTDDPEEKLKYIIQISLTSFMENSDDFIGIMMDFWAEGIRNKSADVLKIIDLEGLYGKFRKLISSILQDGINKGKFRELDTQITASVLIGAFDGLILQMIMNPKMINLKGVAQKMSELILSGIHN